MFAGSSGSDIFQLLVETAEKEKKQRRTELLSPLGVKEFFVDGDISINKFTCLGVECKLCIKVCPTNALFWKKGEVGITKELCIYCGACVLSCMVDHCIKVWRKRENGEVENFSTPRGFIILQDNINAKKRIERVQSVFPTPKEYLKRYKPSMVP
ncbi:MAG: 4Fe-4S dicluster domain-containing protein [Candidatus Bathyarchaeales archaeon]